MTKKFTIEDKIFHFGLDHLEIYGTFKEEKFIDSNKVKIINKYHIKKTKVDKYFFKIIFYRNEEEMKTNTYPLFSYYKGLIDQAIPTKDYVVIYSTGFRLISEDKILFFLDQFNLNKIKRFDIAIDLILDINEVITHFKELTQKGATFNGTKGEIETRYIGESQKSRNKRQLIRIYNKQQDIRYRKKHELYADYLLQENITRIELEIRSELAKNSYFGNLFNVHYLLGILKNYLNKHTGLFRELPGENITLYKKKYEKIDPELYQSTYYRDKRRKIFLGHAKLIFNLGYCPIRVLIQEGYIKDLTKKAIGIENFNELLKKENFVKELAKENKYIRENLEEILANYYKYGKI